MPLSACPQSRIQTYSKFSQTDNTKLTVPSLVNLTPKQAHHFQDISFHPFAILTHVWFNIKRLYSQKKVCSVINSPNTLKAKVSSLSSYTIITSYICPTNRSTERTLSFWKERIRALPRIIRAKQDQNALEIMKLCSNVFRIWR